MNVVIVTKVGLMISVLLAFGCGDNADPKGSGSNNPTPVQPGPDSLVTPTPRDVRAECVSELVRLEGCGQATADERDYLETEFCQSTDFIDGQVATVASCLAQWTCGGAMPACLEDSDPAPECVEDTACPFEHQCRSGVCQPTGGSTVSCTKVRYSFGTVGDGSNQGRTGHSCSLPGDCLSRRCVSASIPDLSDGADPGDFTDEVSWCGNHGDCRSPNNRDEECPSGYTCEEVLRSTFDDEPRWLCVRDSVGELCR